MKCEKCGNETFHGKYIEHELAFYVCRKCRSETPIDKTFYNGEGFAGRDHSKKKKGKKLKDRVESYEPLKEKDDFE